MDQSDALSTPAAQRGARTAACPPLRAKGILPRELTNALLLTAGLARQGRREAQPAVGSKANERQPSGRERVQWRRQCRPRQQREQRLLRRCVTHV
eukprot:6947517-Pyramimonas_sp.AAC.1